MLDHGDVVFGQFEQSRAAAAVFRTCMRAGAVFVPVDPSWPPYLIHKAAARLAPRVVIAKPDALHDLAAIFAGAAALSIEDAANEIVARPDQAPLSEYLSAAYLFTSGSTGVPKLVMHSRRSLNHSAALVLRTFGWRCGERLLNLAELHTMSGLRNALVAAEMGGIEWLPSPTSERATIFDLIALIGESGCERLVAGPSLVRHLALLGDRLDRAPFAGLKAIYCTGAALSAAASQALHARLNLPIVNYYGLTETGGLCLSQDVADWDPADTSLGRPVGCEARLVTADGSIGEQGELQIRSPQIMSGYLGDAAATAARFDGDWLRTGDIMMRDREDRFHLRGRADLFINTRRTERIHPEEIENVLELHPQVSEAAVVGVEDPNGGERVVALIVLHAGWDLTACSHRAMAQFVVDKLGQSRMPNEVRFLNRLPRLASGKLSRVALPELAQ